MRETYLDNAAATPVDLRVQKEIMQAMNLVGNPSAYNDAGRRAAEKLVAARLAIARFLGAHEDEIVFTASGSEANNLAIFGTALMKKVKDIITTPIEHKSVLEPIQALRQAGARVYFLKVDSQGRVDLNKFNKLITQKACLVSIMYANNEIGTVQPIKQIGKIIKDFRLKIDEARYPLFHVDACQAAGYLPMNVNQLGVDLMTFNGSKIYGPRGIGVLYVRRGIELSPQILGGGQERGRRAGTENLPAITGLAKAVMNLESGIKNKESKRVQDLRDYFFANLRNILPNAKINGTLGDDRLPNNIHISIPGLDSENLLLELDKYGIRAGSGSACTSHSVEPSHVLRAIGVKKPYLDGALRFSMGRQTKKKDIDYVLQVLPKIVKELKKRYNV